MSYEYEAVFGNQYLFNEANEDTTHISAMRTEFKIRNGAVYWLNGKEWLEAANLPSIIAVRKIIYPPVYATDEEVEKLINERDEWESKATELSSEISNKFGIDFGDHSSGNCPVDNAITFIRECSQFDLDFQNMFWTKSDYENGITPEIGMLGIYSDGVSRNGVKCEYLGSSETTNFIHVRFEDNICRKILMVDFKPVETAREKYDREREEWLSENCASDTSSKAYINGLKDAYEILKPFKYEKYPQ